MKAFTRRADLLVFLYMCVVGSVWRAAAQPGGGQTYRSLEARIAEAQVVYCATITNLQEGVIRANNHDAFNYRGYFKVGEVLKGVVPTPNLGFEIIGVSEWPDLKKWAAERVPFIWFVNGPEMGSNFFAGQGFIFLGSVAQGPRCGFERVYGSDMTLLTEPKEIVSRARAFAKKRRDVKKFHKIRLPELSHRIIINSYLVVPVEASLERTARHLIAAPGDFISRKTETDRLAEWRCDLRAEGASALQYFKSLGNIRLLKSLLNDPSYWVINYQPAGATNMIYRFYEVRQSAYDVLHGWGVDVPKPVLNEIVPASAGMTSPSSWAKDGSGFLTWGKALYETHVSEGRPSVAIYTKGFVDSSFDAYVSDTNGEHLVFSS